MPTYASSTLSRYTLSGLSSSTLDNKLVQYGKISNKVIIKNSSPLSNIVNQNFKTANNSVSLLKNNAYNRFSSIRPYVIYSLKNRKN